MLPNIGISVMWEIGKEIEPSDERGGGRGGEGREESGGRMWTKLREGQGHVDDLD